jgi:hypothetical protein
MINLIEKKKQRKKDAWSYHLFTNYLYKVRAYVLYEISHNRHSAKTARLIESCFNNE